MTVLITGATGNIGGWAANRLAAEGHDVRALVRDPARATRLDERVERVTGDLDRPDSVRSALEGVDRMFFMQAGHGTGQTEMIIDAARRAGVARIVALSSMGAALDPMPIMGTWFAARERLLDASGLGVTYLRPSTLMTNALWWVPTIRENSTVVDSVGPGLLSSVDTADVADVAVAALTEEGHVGGAYTLTGQELITTAEQVAILGRVLGRELTYVERTPAEEEQASVTAGTPAEAAAAMRDLNEMFRADGEAFLTDEVKRHTGHAPRTFEDWCRRNTDRFTT